MQRGFITGVSFLALLMFAFLLEAILTTSYVLPFSNAQLALVYFLQSGGFFISALLGGYLAEHLGKKRLIVIGTLVMGLGALGFGRFSQSLTLLAFSMFLFGSGGGVVEGVGVSVIGDLYSSRRRSAINAFQVAFGVGAVLGPFVMGRLFTSGPVAASGWTWVYTIAFGASVVIGVLFLLGRFPSSSEASFHFEEARAILRSRTFQMCALLIFLYVAAETCIAAWIVRFMRDAHGASGAVAGGALALFWLGMVASRFLSTFLPERFSSAHVLGVVFVAGGVSTIGIALSPEAAIILCWSFACGFFIGPGWATIASLAVDHFPHRSAAVAGAITALGALGSTVGQPAGGIVGNFFGTRWSLLFAALVMLAGFIILRMGRNYLGRVTR